MYHQLLLKWVDKIVPSINQTHVKVSISRFRVYVCVHIFAYADPCIIVYTYVKTISTVTKISFSIYITFLHSYSSVQRIKTLEKQNLGDYARRCQNCMIPIIWHYRKGKTIAKKKADQRFWSLWMGCEVQVQRDTELFSGVTNVF